MEDGRAVRAEGSAFAPGAERMCPFCHAALAGLPTAACDTCHTAYHDDCLVASGRCAVPGCSRDDPSPQPAAAAPQGPPPPGPPSRPPNAPAGQPPGPPPAAATGSPSWGPPPAAGWTTRSDHAATSVVEDWKDSAELLWGDVPQPVRWVGGIVVGIALLAIVVSVADGDRPAEPETADAPPAQTFEPAADDAAVDDAQPEAALSSDDQELCGEINEQVRSAFADGFLDGTEQRDIAAYAYRYSDVGGTLETAARNATSTIDDAVSGNATEDDMNRASAVLYFLCGYSP